MPEFYRYNYRDSNMSGKPTVFCFKPFFHFPHWNVFVNPDVVGRLRGKLNYWDRREGVGFWHSSVTGAPYFPTDHSELKAHIFLQEFTGMGQQIKTTGLPYQNLSPREYFGSGECLWAPFLMCPHKCPQKQLHPENWVQELITTKSSAMLMRPLVSNFLSWVSLIFHVQFIFICLCRYLLQVSHKDMLKHNAKMQNKQFLPE